MNVTFSRRSPSECTLTPSTCDTADEVHTLVRERDVLLLRVQHQESTIAWLHKSLCTREVEVATLRKIQRLQNAVSTVKDEGEEEQRLRQAVHMYALKLYSSIPQSKEADECLRQLEQEQPALVPPKEEKVRKRPAKMLEHMEKAMHKKKKLDVIEWELMSVKRQLMDVRDMWSQLQHLKCIAAGPEREWFKLVEVDRKLGDVRRKLGRVEGGLNESTPCEA